MPAVLTAAVRALGVAVLALTAGCAGPNTGAGPSAGAGINATAAGSYLIARQAARTRDSETAAKNYQGALSRDPGHRMVIVQAFISELERGNVKAALALIKEADKAGATVPLKHLVLAVDHARNGAWAEARAHLAKTPASPLNRGLVPLLRGWVAVAENNWPAAQQSFARVQAAPGFEPLMLLHRGHAARLSGERDAADQAFRDVLADRTDPSLRLVIATSLHFAATGRPDTASKFLVEHAEPDLDLSALHEQIDRLAAGGTSSDLVNSGTDGMSEALHDVAGALQRDASDTAMILVRLALHMRPSWALARILLGQLLGQRGQHAQALEAYRAITAASAFRSAARVRAAETLKALDRHEDAIRELLALAGEQPGAPAPWIQIGDIESSRKRWDEAVAAYDSAFKRVDATRPRYWNLYFTRGIALERGKRWERAEADFLTALELSPDQPYVMNYLGYSWTEQGVNLDRAEEMIAKAAALQPNDGYIVDSLGWIFYRTGRYGEAVQKLEHAVRLRPNDPTINEHLGDAYWRAGRQIEARYQWRRTLGMEPEAERLGEIRTKLKQGLPPATAGADDRDPADHGSPDA